MLQYPPIETTPEVSLFYDNDRLYDRNVDAIDEIYGDSEIFDEIDGREEDPNEH